jgi:hypothetical protein
VSLALIRPVSLRPTAVNVPKPSNSFTGTFDHTPAYDIVVWTIPPSSVCR